MNVDGGAGNGGITDIGECALHGGSGLRLRRCCHPEKTGEYHRSNQRQSYKAKTQKRCGWIRYSRERVAHEFLLSRLAREVKVVPANSHRANARAANSAGLLAWRPLAGGLPIRLAFGDLAGQWLARNGRRLTVARRRRFRTVFPNTEFAGGCGRAQAQRSVL